MRRNLLLSLGLMVALATPAAAQISISYTFVDETVAEAAEVNANFQALASAALNRTGGTITGAVTVSGGITIDGVDIGVQACTACTPTLAGLTISGTGAAALDVGGGLNLGTGNVALVDTTGKIPALTTTYFASVDGAALTGLLEAAIADGTVYPRSGAVETIGGNWTFSNPLTVTNNSAGSLDIGGGINAGTGNVALVDATGKITAISSTYFASLDGTALTGVGKLATAANWTTVQTNAAQPRARAFNSAVQSLTSGSEAALTFDSETFDAGAVHSTSSTTSRLTVPVGGAGTWACAGQLGFAAQTGGIRQARIRKNGATIVGRSRYGLPGGAETVTVPVMSMDVAADGDYYELLGLQDSGSAVNTVAGDPDTYLTCWLQF